MDHSDIAGAARPKLRPAPGSAAPADAGQALQSRLSSVSFIEQEPDLAKESGQRARDASAWAAGGQPPE